MCNLYKKARKKVDTNIFVEKQQNVCFRPKFGLKLNKRKNPDVYDASKHQKQIECENKSSRSYL